VSGPHIPTRLAVAVDLVDVRPGQRILEIGGGRGVAAWLVCSALEGGRLIGIDRSPRAVGAATRLNQVYVDKGLAEFREAALEQLDPDELGTFDTIFAINVNVFWTRPAAHEIGLVVRLLRPGGRLLLMYSPPAGSDHTRLAARISPRLEDAGLRSTMRVEPADADVVLCFEATRS
jgi:SAM-dependent methyltransferase